MTWNVYYHIAVEITLDADIVQYHICLDFFLDKLDEG